MSNLIQSFIILSISLLSLKLQGASGFLGNFKSHVLNPKVTTIYYESFSFKLYDLKNTYDEKDLASRRNFLFSFPSSPILTGYFVSQLGLQSAKAGGYPPIDVNNAMAREFTAFPGLYPTIATKIVNAAKKKPFKSKADVYAALDTDVEKDRLKMYDSSIKVMKVDKNLQQFKGSQICKFECGSRVSNSFRDEQIRAVQNDRK